MYSLWIVVYGRKIDQLYWHANKMHPQDRVHSETNYKRQRICSNLKKMRFFGDQLGFFCEKIYLLSLVKLVTEGAGARGHSPLCVGPPGPAALPNIVKIHASVVQMHNFNSATKKNKTQ